MRPTLVKWTRTAEPWVSASKWFFTIRRLENARSLWLEDNPARIAWFRRQRTLCERLVAIRHGNVPWRFVDGSRATCLLLLAALACAPAGAITLTGNLKYPSGTGATGTLYLSLSEQGTQLSTGECGGPNALVPTYQVQVPVVAGAIQGSPSVVANDCIEPTNSYYNVQLRDTQSNLLFATRWSITAAICSSTNVCDVGVIPPMAVPTATAPSETLLNTPQTWSAPQTFQGGINARVGQNSLTAYNINNILYVDGVKYNGATDLGGTINTMIEALPGCTDVFRNTFAHCGVIIVPPGDYPWKTNVTVTSPYISIIAPGGRLATRFDASGLSSGCALSITSNPFTVANAAGRYSGFTIGGNSVANACGIHFYDVIGLHLDDLEVDDFTGTSAVGIWEDAISDWTERTRADVWVLNNTIGWQWSVQAGAAGASLGYGIFDVWANCNANQICFQTVGPSSSPGVAQVQDATLNLTANAGGSNNATCFSFPRYAVWTSVVINLMCDGGASSGAIPLSIGATAKVSGIGSLSRVGSLSADFVQGQEQLIYLDNNGSSATELTFEQQEAATSAATNVPVPICFHGQYWTGTASALDRWCMQEAINPGANGNSAVNFTHTGSSGVASVNVPNLFMPSGSYGITLEPPTSPTQFDHIFFPDAIGTVGLQGANGVSSGTIALSGGSASHSFGTPYNSPPTCVAADTTKEAAVKVTSSTIAVSVAGSGSDVVAWVCTPSAN